MLVECMTKMRFFGSLAKSQNQYTGYLLQVRLLFTSESCLARIWFHSCITKNDTFYLRPLVLSVYWLELTATLTHAARERALRSAIYRMNIWKRNKTNKCLESCLDVQMPEYTRCTERWSERECEIMMGRLNFRLFCFEKVANFINIDVVRAEFCFSMLISKKCT